jgi:CCR4-NOT transcription complex subunit 6
MYTVWCGRWKARSEAILEQLLSFDADFLCLQELDEFESFYKWKLDKHGYSSVYVQRSGRKRDGCGIFFRRARYMPFMLSVSLKL